MTDTKMNHETFKAMLDAVKSQQNDDKNAFQKKEAKIEHQGTKIVLPNDPRPMTYDEGIQALQMRKKEDETVVSVNEIVKAFPFDGAYAFMNAMKTMYGWATPVPTPGFFGDRPPQTISLEIGPDQTTQIIWGDFVVPSIDGKLRTGTYYDDSGMVYFCIQGQVKKSAMPEVKKLADLTRAIVKEHSIYRGKAIRLEVDDDGDVNFDIAPKFLDLTKVNPDELTYSEEVMAQIKTNLFTPIVHTKKCKEMGIPLKRGVLLQGPYGTGKTLAAFVTATMCEANGWTFILLPQVAGLDGALAFARMYGPAVVFAEDIDRAVTGERSVAMDDILNTIDGIESKGSDTITILTSNHVENINPAMLRPGRLDAIIHVTAPDAKAAEKLVRIYAREALAKDADLTEVGAALEGKIPAVIREIVERSKLFAISRDPEADSIMVTEKDLLYSAHEMKTHLDLLIPKKEGESKEVVFYNLFKEMVASGVTNGVSEGVEDLEDATAVIKSNVEAIRRKIG